jgi:hypothetical protein
LASQAKINRSLMRAREALEGGRISRALKHAWEAGLPASSSNDGRSLREVIEVGRAIRDGAADRDADEAARLVAYCTEALEHPHPKRTLWAGLRTGDGGVGRETKTCPDCAETIKAAAKVCRYCSHRFEATAYLGETHEPGP